MSRPRAIFTAMLILVSALAVAACGAGSPAPTATPVAITTPEAAVDAVRAVTPLFDGLEVRQADLIGQGSYWEASQAADGWTVSFTVGWGDCPSGCIDRHTWTWQVAADGTPAFETEEGSLLTEEILAGLRAASTAQGVAGRALSGPTCPVERPGDPACAPRAVNGAVLVVQGAGGAEAARFTTDGSGLFRIHLEPGSYTLVPSPVEGFMGGAAPVTFDVLAGDEAWLIAAYDTGIR